MEHVQVIIVGAGVAGLSAAKTLGPDVNYVVIEAQDYVGGRIRTVDVAPNLTVDFGAQYIHGNENNTVFDICSELDMLLPKEEEPDDNAKVYTTDGKVVDSELFEKASDLWNEVKTKAGDSFGDQSGSSPVAYTDFVPQEFQKQLSSSSSVSGDLIQPLTEYFMKLEMMETGCCPLSDLNLIEFFNYQELGGEYENNLKNGGYRPFINHLKSFIPDNNRIRLNSEVVRVKFDEGESKLLVEINSLKENRVRKMTCDHMIWTTSLGHLKQNFHSIFASETNLIEQKQNAIANLGFGVVDKVFMIYGDRFWPEDSSRFILLQSQKNQSINVSDSLRQKLHAERVDQNTFREIINMPFHYDVLPSTNRPVLICWFVGQPAIFTEGLSEQLVGQICHEVLCTYMGVDQKQYQPIQVVKTAWYGNKYVRGGYTYQSVRSTKVDGEQLRESYEPDGVKRIVFAGEATHEGYYSTVNAALETGSRAAEEVRSIIG